ncbi:hypothetical protein EJ07DRAFT_157149 [Lizonia empirigonia]|nr:hypothetical protein EJ07DRAFT_157149 [Lizonia empirigonia]
MSSSRYTTEQKGKGKARTSELDGALRETATKPSRLPLPVKSGHSSSMPTSSFQCKTLQPINTQSESLASLSLPTSPVQGSKILLNKRIPVRPAATALISGSSSEARATHRSSAAIDAAPSSEEITDAQIDTPRTAERAETIRLGPVAEAAQYLAGTVTATQVPASLQANLARFWEAVEKSQGPGGVNTGSECSIARLPYSMATEMEEAYFPFEERIREASIETQLKRLGESYTRLSTITDRSVTAFSIGEAEPTDDVLLVLVSTPLGARGNAMANSGSHPSPASSPRRSYSSERESQNVDDFAQDDTSICHLGDGCKSLLVVPEYRYLSEERRRNNNAYIRQSTVSTSQQGMSDSSATSAMLLQNVVRASRENAGKEAEQSGASRSLPPSVSVPENEKLKTPSISSSRMCLDWPVLWRFLAMLLVTAIFLGFLIVALITLGKTRTYTATPSQLFTSSPRTISSKDGTSNLTISWAGREALNFSFNSASNTTMGPDERNSDAWQFLFDWSANGVGLGPYGESKLISSMPVPSFWDEYVKSVAFLGVSIGIYSLAHITLQFFGKLWQRREDEGIYWTAKLLRRFNKAKRLMAIALAIIPIKSSKKSPTRALVGLDGHVEGGAECGGLGGFVLSTCGLLPNLMAMEPVHSPSSLFAFFSMIIAPDDDMLSSEQLHGRVRRRQHALCPEPTLCGFDSTVIPLNDLWLAPANASAVSDL